MNFKDSCAFAFLQGLTERLRYGDGFGRTHASNQDWNEAYDKGANIADRITFWR